VSEVLLVERLAGAAIAIVCVLAGLRFAIARVRLFAGGPFRHLAGGSFQRLADGSLQHFAGGPSRHLAGGFVAGLRHLAGSWFARFTAAGSKARRRHERVLAVLENAYLPGAASVHLVRAGPRLLVIGRSAGAIVALCELEADAHPDCR
jgi:hypothetical protein